jgi:DNA replication and repair protein RecF
MFLKTLSLTNFRSYPSQTFSFSPLTIFVGKNTMGKTNVLEAIHMLSSGKSFRAEKDVDMIKLGQGFATIDAQLQDDSHTVKISTQLINNTTIFHKRYLLNGVGKRHSDFADFFCSTIFSPQDLELISESPNHRRRYIDTILSMAFPLYRRALSTYTKGLRQRNKLLGLIREGKHRYSPDEFTYWNTLLIEQAALITEYRQNLVSFINESEKKVYDLSITYDTSEFTESRLTKYKDAERAAGVTLIGPQRDDFLIMFPDKTRLIREFASRGEQRMTVLQLKLLEIFYLKEKTDQIPLLLLDDIFSELDAQNIAHIARLLPSQQTIITTTELDYIPEEIVRHAKIVTLPIEIRDQE